MIIITDQPHKVADWIEANCEQPSAYTLGRAWSRDELTKATKVAPTEITLNLTPTDQTLFDLMFAGCFVRNPFNDRWYDDTPLSRMMIKIQGENRELSRLCAGSNQHYLTSITMLRKLMP